MNAFPVTSGLPGRVGRGNSAPAEQDEILPGPPESPWTTSELASLTIRIHASRFQGDTLCGDGECSWQAAWDLYTRRSA